MVLYSVIDRLAESPPVGGGIGVLPWLRMPSSEGYVELEVVSAAILQ